MPRYIDADELQRKLEEIGLSNGTTLGTHSGKCDLAAYIVDNAPTADVAPVVHGRWEQDDYGFYCCSKCYYEWDESEYKTPFCPNCGAKMDLED